MEDLVNKIIPFLPPYGPFELRTIVKHIKSPAERGMASTSKVLVDIEDYLVENGFAIKRSDLQNGGREYLELTDMGRQLKSAGSVKVFVLNRDHEARRTRSLERLGYRQNRINFWIALGTCTAAIYYLLEILNHFYHFYP
ncbi:MAG: hypothetical protein JST70_12550 [Bacteroidetes bacterium]|nr:hypothetical protein [Bacteroidota bacterium]